MIIQRALGVGFTLEELATLFRARDRGQHPCRDVRALAERKLHDVERQLEDLVRFREALEQMLRDWDRRLAKRKGDGLARLLESLASGPQFGSSHQRALAFDRGKKRTEQGSGLHEP